MELSFPHWRSSKADFLATFIPVRFGINQYSTRKKKAFISSLSRPAAHLLACCLVVFCKKKSSSNRVKYGRSVCWHRHRARKIEVWRPSQQGFSRCWRRCRRARPFCRSHCHGLERTLCREAQGRRWFLAHHLHTRRPKSQAFLLVTLLCVRSLLLLAPLVRSDWDSHGALRGRA